MSDGYVLTDGYSKIMFMRELIAISDTVCATCGHTSSKHRPMGNRKCGISVPGHICACTQFVPTG